MPKGEGWKEFSNWGDEYGDVVYARVLNQDIVILNSYEAAVDLLERRSAIYSSRPRLVLAGDLVGWNLSLGFMPYGNHLKETRKLLHEGMSTKAMEELCPLVEREVLKFVQRLSDTPEEFIQHIRQTAGAIVLKLTYGYEVKDNNDRFVQLADRTMDMFSVVSTPGAFLVDSFPLLNYIPWAPFKSKAKAWSKLLWEFVELPMGFAKQQMWAAHSIYAGGSDTTVSAISSFFAAMIHYPSVQAAAQEEIDRVVGTERLPTYTDRSSLPYIEALYKEVLRWQPIGPLGVPHNLSSKEDDIYRGMHIPKNSTIIANIWRMARDPNTYRDPTAFNPQRFLGSPEKVEKNPEDIVFGFGRRRCPGINVASSSVWLSIALTLATYNITAATGLDNEPRLPNLHYSEGTIRYGLTSFESYGIGR
ncbi:cytochrome P450 family protein [Ceratobasidium sp. AG-Ba]|nr:cytochrome P450 family protein [Ceratobasidium sp. AG-Ba]